MQLSEKAPSSANGRRGSSSSTARERFPELDSALAGADQNDYDSTHKRRLSIDVPSRRATSPRKVNGIGNGSPSLQRIASGLPLQLPESSAPLSSSSTKGAHSQAAASFSGSGYGAVNGNRAHRHGRQRSLSDAWRTIRTRRASVSENAQEIAEALKAPLSIKLVILCLIWYLSSALTNTSSKSILNSFPKPITLTVIQFGCVSSWCISLSLLSRLFPWIRSYVPALKHGICYPSRDVIRTTLPLALFQIGGHILSSTATEKIPVSLVHTIKGLSPLLTVLAYRFLYEIQYSTETYLSLIPLTVGVVLACSVEFSGNFFGIMCAFGSALIFVTQNIFSKKLFNDAARTEAESNSTTSKPGAGEISRKLDKLNLLCYCSGLAFLLTFPIWLWTDALPLYSSPLSLTPHLSPTPRPNSSSMRLILDFFINGVFHFAQNILAFILLSMTSPVTYSVASLIKRVFVILMAIIWFGQQTTIIQALGIALTFLGLYLYDRTSDSAKAQRRAKLEQSRLNGPLLPLSSVRRSMDGVMDGVPNVLRSSRFQSVMGRTSTADSKPQ